MSRDVDTSAEHTTDVVTVQVPPGFAHEEALKEICVFLIGWLHTGGTVREALRRLRGWVPEE